MGTALLTSLLLSGAVASSPSAELRIQRGQEAFFARSGVQLVFERDRLGDGDFCDRMPALAEKQKLRAIAIALTETKKYPPGYLGSIGLKTLGIFAACVSNTGDGHRPYERELGGYRYFGIYDGRDTVAAAFYSVEQLPLTLHHEIFHHVDSTHHGRTSHASHFASDDRRFQRAVSGRAAYARPIISAQDLRALRRQADGYVLDGPVSDYASKAPGEDQAETARYFMTTLADALVQTVDRPQSPGSQRILHVMKAYQEALLFGPTADWFVDVALDRQEGVAPAAAIAAVDKAFRRAQRDRSALARSASDVRGALARIADADPASLTSNQRTRVVKSAAGVTHALMRQRIVAGDSTYVVWGEEDATGANATLRADLIRFGDDAACLGRLLQRVSEQHEVAARAQLKSLRLLADYHGYIVSHWPVTPGTQAIFDETRDRMVEALPREQKALGSALSRVDWPQLAVVIDERGRPSFGGPNRYLRNVDTEITDVRLRAEIHRVQPATVRFTGASGVNISPTGRILTAAHVADRLGSQMTVTFPDGGLFLATCVAIDHKWDLALMDFDTPVPLPYAPIASRPPSRGTRVVVIGQPGSTTPGGHDTGYEPFTVSTGRIRGFKPDRLGSQMLGGTMHDAWTYWGHSGSPLFDSTGHIVGLHNSWDPDTGMRHAVTYEAIDEFVRRHEANPPHSSLLSADSQP